MLYLNTGNRIFRPLILALLPVMALAACGPNPPQKAVKAVKSPPQNTLHLYVRPPSLQGVGEVGLRQQAMGAFAQLRNQAQAQGFSLRDCRQIVVFVRNDGLGRNGWKTLRDVQRHYFDTPLTPNSPSVHLIAVSGFANPDQLLLVEADFSR